MIENSATYLEVFPVILTLTQVWTLGEMTKEEAEAMAQGVSLDMEASPEKWWDQVSRLHS